MLAWKFENKRRNHMKHGKRLLSLVLVLAMVMGLCPAVMAAPAAGSAEIYDLTVNNLVEPMGTEADPVFGWKMSSDVIGAAQTAYAITVTAEDGTVAWDTGWVESGDSTDIPYGGSALVSSTRYTVSVKVKDQAGAETAAASTTFETGLLEADAFADTKFISYQTGYLSDTTKYTIDFDFILDNAAQGFCFGMKDTGTFVMWQLNSNDNAATDKAVLLRPHFKSGGNWTAYPGLSGSTLENKDVTAAVGYNTDEIEGKLLHERIEVDGKVIKTYFGKDADSLTLAYEYTHTTDVPLYNIGFRHATATGTDGVERSYYDNIVVRDGNGEVIYENDFSSGVTVEGTSDYSVTDGMLFAQSNGERVGMIMAGSSGNGSSLPAFRKSFTPAKAVKSAKLYTSGLGVYENYLNGQRVGNKKGDKVVYDEMKPGFTTASKRMSYSSYDITWMLAEGENVLSSIVTSGWWHGSAGQMTQGNELAYLAKLVITYEDGTKEVINTDTSWKTAKAAPVLTSTGIYQGEDFDARISTEWMLPGYNDSGWGNVKINNEFKGKLTAWHGTPIMIREDLELAPVSLTVYEGATGAATNQHGKINVVATYEDGQDVVLKPGQTLLVNFGQNFAGREAFTVTSEAGTKIHVEHGEWLNDGNGATSRGNDGPEGSIYNANYRSARAETNYWTAGGTESWNPLYSFYGFQYIAFTADKEVTFHDVRGEVMTSVQGETGTMTTSDEGVNQLISNAVWGMYSNYLAVPTDCPQRDERMGWTADTQVFCLTGMFLGDNKAFLEKAMEDIVDSQYTSGSLNGAYPDVAPNTGYGGDGAYGWADCGIILPYTLYMMYGDKGVINDNWASMQYYMDTFLANTTYGGKQNYCDWLCYETQTTITKNMLGLAFVAWDAQMMVEMANAIGDTAAAEKYQQVYETRKAQYISEFVNADGTVKGGTQAVCLYSLYVDLLPNEASYDAVVNQLISNIEANGNKLGTGFLGTAIIMNTLVKIGRADVAYKLLLQRDNPSWLYSVDQGATTYWERWNTYTIATGFGAVSMNSFNHYAYGAVIGWMYNQAAGIGFDAAQPGFKRIVLSPNPDQTVSSVHATYDSAYGPITSNYDYADGSLVYQAQIPANTTAAIHVPVEDVNTLKVNGKALADLSLAADGIVYEGYADGVATFEAVSAPMFTFTSDVAVKHTVQVNVQGDANMSPVEAEITVNGETTKAALSNTLSLPEGTEVSIKATPLNFVDYAVKTWTKDGEVVAEGDTYTFTVTGEMTVTANVEYIGLVSLAEGKTVTATAVNNSWAGNQLTDGNLNLGWSSAKQSGLTFSEVSAVIDLGVKTEFNHLRLYPRSIVGYGIANCPTSWTVYVSDDNATWTPVYSITDTAPVNGYAPYTMDLEETANARYIKLGVTAVNRPDEHDGVYVQIMEMGVYNLSAEMVNVRVESVSEGTDVVPMNVNVAVNGETVSTTLPANLMVKKGDKITASAELLNPVDYTVKSWTVGETVMEGAELSWTADGEATVKLNIGWNGFENLAQGKTVTADAVNTSWAAAYLVDGKLSYLGGTNGWSSLKLGTGVTTFEEAGAVIDLGAETQFNRFHIYPRNLPSAKEGFGLMNFPVAYTIYVSNDNAAWEPVFATTEGAVTNGFEPVVIELDKAVSARYVKYGVTAINSPDENDGSYVQLSEFGVYTTAEPIDPDQEAAAAVDAAIEAIGEVTLNSKAAIDEARAAYDKATDAVKALVTKLDVLEAAEAKLAELKEAAEQEAADKKAAAEVDALIAAIGDVTLNSKAAIDEARAAYDKATDAVKALVTKLAVLEAAEAAYAELTKPVDKTVKLLVTGEESVFVHDEEVTFTVSGQNMNRLATVVMSLEMPANVEGEPVLTAAEGWSIIGRVYKDNVLTVAACNIVGANGEGDLFSVTATLSGDPGDATVTVTEATLSVYLDEGEEYVDADLTEASATTEVKYNRFDVNKDGVVDQLDMTRAQRYFGTDFADADVNGDKTVDINDLILILNNYDGDII